MKGEKCREKGREHKEGKASETEESELEQYEGKTERFACTDKEEENAQIRNKREKFGGKEERAGGKSDEAEGKVEGFAGRHKKRTTPKKMQKKKGMN